MIHIENLSKNYKDLQAVDQISFDIKKDTSHQYGS